MFENDTLNVISRYLHILMAITLLGGTIFMRFVLLPAADDLTEEDRQKTLTAARSRWAKIVMIAAAFLLLSGLFNTAAVFVLYKVKPYYHALLGLKILLALIVFFIASAVSGRSEMAKKMQQKEKFWLHVNFVLAATLVLLASVMKFAEREPKPHDTEAAAAQNAPLDPDLKV